MSSKWIEPWAQQRVRDLLVTYTESQVLEPESVYPGWMNLVTQRSVRAIAIAPKSRHIWMATWGGVLSWRQREESIYYRYSSEHGLAGNTVTCLCIDKAERPWVGQAEGGLSYFDGRRWQGYDHLQRETIGALSSAVDGIWAATADAVYHISGPDRVPLPVAVGKEGAAGALALLSDGDDLLLGNRSGLFRLQRGSHPSRLAGETVSACVALARDTPGRIWIGTPDNVYPLEEGDVTGSAIYDGQSGCVREIAAGKERIWILTSEGLSEVKDNQWRPVPILFAEEQAPVPLPQTIAASANDNYLWVGTDKILSSLYFTGEGTTDWDHQILPLHAEDELSNLGRCVAESPTDGKIWIGTAGGLITYNVDDKWSVETTTGDIRGLCLANFGQAEDARQTLCMLTWPMGISALGLSARQPPGLPLALLSDQDGYACALTSSGLWRLGGVATRLAEKVPSSAHCIAQMPDRIWWVGTTEGVYQYLAGNWTLANERPGPLLGEVFALAVIDGRLWVATETGIWSRAGNRWESHNLQQTRQVRVLAPAGDAGKLWLAQEEGVIRYDYLIRAEDKKYTTAQTGLASRRVTALLESRGSLWIVTQAGISRLKLSEEETHE